MDFRLEVTGAVKNTLRLSMDDLREQYAPCSVDVQFQNNDGTVNATFVGARLWDILQAAEISTETPDKLRVMARASDKFRCLLRWNEVDPAVSERVILVAYEQDGKPFASKEGALRLVVPGDKQGRRKLRGLARITVLD